MGEMGNSYLLEATVTNHTNTFYLCIDLKSFYASVECVERGLDPMTTLLAVADPERTEKTICLAITPAMKALGIKNRCRVFEIPKNIDYIMAVPRMHLYLEYSARIYGVYLKYIAKEDIHVYSVDEAFLDVTHYLAMYRMNAKELGLRIMQDIYETTGIRATCGIGTNLYLCKIALDIMAKKSPDFVGALNEARYRRLLWDHLPLTDFWSIGGGTVRRLANYGIWRTFCTGSSASTRNCSSTTPGGGRPSPSRTSRRSGRRATRSRAARSCPGTTTGRAACSSPKRWAKTSRWTSSGRTLWRTP